MTMIDPTPATPTETPAPTITSETISDEITAKVAYLEDRATRMENLALEQRNKVSRLYRELNEMISNDGLSESDEISFGDLSLLLSGIFDTELEFVKEYDVQVTFTVYANLTIKAASKDDAMAIAEDISLSFDESDLDIDDDTTTVDESYIDSTNVEYCREN